MIKIKNDLPILYRYHLVFLCIIPCGPSNGKLIKQSDWSIKTDKKERKKVLLCQTRLK